MSAWEPGDVAVVTAANHRDEYEAYYDGDTWRQRGANMFCVNTPTSHRPLVVIDPEDFAQVEALAGGEGKVNTYWLQDRLRSLVAPKPDEPTGLGAVVQDAGDEYVHFGNGCWIKAVPNAQMYQRTWSHMTAAVKVLSEGVSS